MHQILKKQILTPQQRTVRRQGGNHPFAADKLKTLQHIHAQSGERQAQADAAAVQHRQHVVLRCGQHFDIEQRMVLGDHLDRRQQTAPVDVRDYADRQLALQPQRQFHRMHLQLLELLGNQPRVWH
ncbi:hypothetical protein D3C81_1884560 [compost metagenome]